MKKPMMVRLGADGLRAAGQVADVLRLLRALRGAGRLADLLARRN